MAETVEEVVIEAFQDVYLAGYRSGFEDCDGHEKRDEAELRREAQAWHGEQAERLMQAMMSLAARHLAGRFTKP